MERLFPLHGIIQPGNMHEAIAVSPGHPRIDQGDDLAGMIDCGARRIDGGTQGAIAVLVRGRDLNEGHIDTPGPVWPEEGWNIGQKHRRITGPPGVDGSTFALTDEDRAHMKVPHPTRVRVRGWAKRECREELDVP